ncbi:hypothetical protein [Streptomyces griseorubiginosus]|uniref:hypothetical protein n=1 Tax=Streptomyces griseorubiginosus TaxID=67304 RepID=UPI00340375B8
MPALLIVVAVLAVLVAGAALYRLHRVRRALIAERASARLVGRMQARDLDAFRSRVNELLQERAVVREAEQVLDTALATHHSNPEGGQS